LPWRAYTLVVNCTCMECNTAFYSVTHDVSMIRIFLSGVWCMFTCLEYRFLRYTINNVKRPTWLCIQKRHMLHNHTLINIVFRFAIFNISTSVAYGAKSNLFINMYQENNYAVSFHLLWFWHDTSDSWYSVDETRVIRSL